jgi:uncharacterized membrane protein
MLEILRGITTLLWAILLIVPGVIYSARTIFYDIMMIEKGKVAYGRPVLKQSADFVKGRTWDVIKTLILLSLCIFLPVAIIDGMIIAILTIIDTRLETLAAVLSDFIDSFAAVFYMVCVVTLYAELKKNSNLSSSR